MRYLKRFENNQDDIKIINFDEDMMFATSYVINVIPITDNAFIGKTVHILKSTLSERVYNKLFKWPPINPRDFLILFITDVFSEEDLYKISDKTVIHEGADGEDEYVLALEINERIVLLLHSPDRGSSIRIQDDNYTIKKEEVVEILKQLCELYNEKL
jgi:hypothetical protein